MASFDIKKEKEKMDAIDKLARPSNVSEVRAFVGLINLLYINYIIYYDRFIENLSDIIRLLNGLLKKNIRFKWAQECEKVFNCAK